MLLRLIYRISILVWVCLFISLQDFFLDFVWFVGLFLFCFATCLGLDFLLSALETNYGIVQIMHT